MIIYNCNFCGNEFKVKGSRELAPLLQVCPECRKKDPQKMHELKVQSDRIKKAERDKYWAEHPEEYKEHLRLRKEKRDKTVIEKYGSLENAEKARMQKQLETMKQRYPDEDWENITNPSQVTFVKKKISDNMQNYTPEFYKERQKKTNQTKIELHGSLEKAYEEMTSKLRQTSLERYGVESYAKTEENKQKHRDAFAKKVEENPNYYKERYQKTEETRIEKYGSLEEAFSQAIAKAKQTNLKKYGVENYAQTEESRQHMKELNAKFIEEDPDFWRKRDEKSKQTRIEKYGSLEEANRQALEKRQKTCLEIYGTLSPLQNEEVKEKIKNTWMNLYGVDNPSKVKATRQKAHDTIIERYGDWKNTRTSESRRLQKQKTEEENLKKYKEIDFKKLGFKYFEKNNKPWVKCLNCRTEFELVIPPSQILRLHCFKCNPIQYGSILEKDIVNDIVNLGINRSEIICNSRKIIDGKELDIYIPKYNIAIEYDGSYWHNSEKRDSNYHISKTLSCTSKGIRLIHIFDEEFYGNYDLMMATLKKAFNLCETRIGARKCEIRNLDNETYKEFLEDNHFQGYAPASVKIGLIYNEELVACMSFAKPRNSVVAEWELCRYCEKSDIVIFGGKQKLLSYFERVYNPSSLITYCDFRWFDGKSCLDLGFKFKERTEPSYKYFLCDGKYNFQSKNLFQKSKMKDIPNFKFDESLSEWENMKNNSYLRIFDCGEMVYIKEYNNG